MTKAMKSLDVEDLIAYVQAGTERVFIDVQISDIISDQITISKTEALALAHWILETFEKEE